MKLPQFIFKCLLGSALALGLSSAGATSPAEKPSFLFIGNSFTSRHNLPDLVKSLAAEGQPDKPIFTAMVGYGGRDLFRHYELFKSHNLLRIGSLTDADLRTSIEEMRGIAAGVSEPAFYSEYWQKIDASALVPFEEYEAKANGVSKRSHRKGKAHGRWDEDRELITRFAIKNHRVWVGNRDRYPASWDYVVLQSWHDIKSDPQTGYLKYAAKFAELAKAQNTKPILYITSSYSQNDVPVNEPIEPERALQEVRLAADLARKIDAIVVPVPLAIYRLQKAGAPLTLRYRNDGHPNQLCAYLTACLFYAAVFDRSPEGLKFCEVVETKVIDSAKSDLDPDGNPRKRVLTDEERTLLQREAWETIQAFRSGQF